VTGGFDVKQEVADQFGIEIFEPELRRHPTSLLAREAKEQPERVAIARDRMSARLHLGAQTIGEEPLEQRG
jgi:hypothetical protein